MSRGALATLALIGTAIAAGIAIVLASPQARERVVSGARRMAAAASERFAEVQARLGSGYRRELAVLQELGPTMDTATTQYESSLIVSKVSSALASEPRLRGRAVGVRMIGGILHLEGEVQSPEEKQIASEIARRSSGAELVANDLKIAGSVP